MAARQYYYAESLSESTTTRPDQDKTTLTFTPDASSTYFLFASWEANGATATISVKSKLVKTTATAATYNSFWTESQYSSHYLCHGAIGIFTSGGSPGSETFKIQYSSETGAITAKIRNARIVAIKQHASDQSVESLTRATEGSGSYTDKASLTFTPASQGDYVIIAAGTWDNDGSNQRPTSVKLDVDGSAYGECGSSANDGLLNNQTAANGTAFWGVVKRVNLTATSHTIKCRFKRNATFVTAGFADNRIVALRADAFDDNYYADSTSRVTTTSTSYQDGTSLTQTPRALAHLVLASAILDTSDTSNASQAQFLQGATQIAVQDVRDNSTSVVPTQHVPFFAVYEATLAASSTTWKFQYKSSSTNTTGMDEQAISVLQLDATPSSVFPKALVLGQAVNRSVTY